MNTKQSSNHPLGVTILLPVYSGDKEEWFKIALQSICDQTYSPLRLIILQDGPVRFDLHAALRDIPSDRLESIKISSSPTNLGLGPTLQRGLQEAQTQWIARMDADDWCDPSRIEKQVEHILKHPEIAVLGTAMMEFVKDYRKPYATKPIPISSKQIKNRIALRNPINHSTVLLDREKVLAVGGYRENLYLEDYDLWMRMLFKGFRLENIPQALYSQRMSPAIYTRRGGYTQLIREIRLRNEMRRLGLINSIQFLVAAAIQVPVRLAPSFVRKLLWSLTRVKTSSR